MIRTHFDRVRDAPKVIGHGSAPEYGHLLRRALANTRQPPSVVGRNFVRLAIA